MPAVEFERGDARNKACFLRRGFDFAHAVRTFLDPHRIAERLKQSS